MRGICGKEKGKSLQGESRITLHSWSHFLKKKEIIEKEEKKRKEGNDKNKKKQGHGNEGAGCGLCGLKWWNWPRSQKIK